MQDSTASLAAEQKLALSLSRCAADALLFLLLLLPLPLLQGKCAADGGA